MFKSKVLLKVFPLMFASLVSFHQSKLSNGGPPFCSMRSFPKPLLTLWSSSQTSTEEYCGVKQKRVFYETKYMELTLLASKRFLKETGLSSILPGQPRAWRHTTTKCFVSAHWNEGRVSQPSRRTPWTPWTSTNSLPPPLLKWSLRCSRKKPFLAPGTPTKLSSFSGKGPTAMLKINTKCAYNNWKRTSTMKLNATQKHWQLFGDSTWCTRCKPRRYCLVEPPAITLWTST